MNPDPSTGELLPAGLPVPGSIEELVEIQRRITRAKLEALEEGLDYGTFGTITTPALFAAGAAKLEELFGYTHHHDDPVERLGPGGELVGIRSRCTVYRPTPERDVRIGDANAYCGTEERGKQAAPYNTLLRIAEKRSYVAVIRKATRSAALFVAEPGDDPGDDDDPKPYRPRGK